jgi:hypothetical protein
MHDDELMDRLLSDAMIADAPTLSPAFDERVMRRVRPRGLTPIGRAAIALYVVIAAAIAVWLMRDLPVMSIAAALAISVPVAAAASAYGRRLAVGHS